MIGQQGPFDKGHDLHFCNNAIYNGNCTNGKIQEKRVSQTWLQESASETMVITSHKNIWPERQNNASIVAPVCGRGWVDLCCMICALYETVSPLYQNWHGDAEKSAVGQSDSFVVLIEELEKNLMLFSTAGAH